MSNYKLKLRTNEVFSNPQGTHSGYFLEERDDDDNIIKVYAVDLDPALPMNIEFIISESKTQAEAENEINKPEYTYYDIFTSGTDEEISRKSLEAYNKIMMEAAILNMYSNKLEYNVYNYNCNTSTAFFADEFVSGYEGNGIFIFFNKSGVFLGSSANFASMREVQNVHAIVEEIISKMEAAEYDFGSEILPLNCELNADRFSFEIGGEKFTILNEVSDTVTFTEGNQTVYSIDRFAESSTAGYEREISFSEGGNKYYGGYGDDTVFAGSENDYIDAGKGTNIIYGKGGSDTYVYRAGCGTLTIEDIIEDGQGNSDKIIFGTGTGNLTFKAFGEDLYIYTTNQNNGQPCIIIKKFFALIPQRIEVFEFEGSSSGKITLGQTRLKYAIDSSANVVTHRATGYGDYVLLNLEKENIVYAVAGDNIIASANKASLEAAKIDTPNTIVYGGTGNDTIAIGHGNHEIHAGGGYNQIYLGHGVSDVYLEEGNHDLVEVQELFAGHELRIHNFNPSTLYGTRGMDYWQQIGNDVWYTEDGKGRIVLVDALQYFDFKGQNKAYKNPLRK